MWKGIHKRLVGIVIYNFNGNDIPHALQLEIGDIVCIQEEYEEWFRGVSVKNWNVRGIFPTSYIKIKQESSDAICSLWDDAIVQEATSVLREWGQLWKNLYVSLRDGEEQLILWETIKKTIFDVTEWRKFLINGTLTSDQILQLKLKIARKIDWGNRTLGLDLVPRLNGEMVDPVNISVVELFQVHSVSTETSQHNMLTVSAAKKKSCEKINSYHLFFCMRDFTHQVGENMEIFFALYNAATSSYITENFLVKQPKEGFNNYVDRTRCNCTIFTDLGTKDVTCQLYIIARIVRVGKMVISDNAKKSSAQSYRRPYGAAIFKLDPLKPEEKETEYLGKVQTTDEKDMWQLPELMIKKLVNKFSPISNNASIVASVKLFEGDFKTVVKENALILKDVEVTRKLEFSDVIMPGEIRNDFFVTLSYGDFEKGGKSVGKNVEITVIAVDLTGHPVPCMFAGTGHKAVSEFTSTIIYHNNAPHWCEQIKVAVPIEIFSKVHLRLEFRHCSTREKNEKKLFGFSFIRLMEDEGGTTLRNGPHELCIYKCEDRARLLVPAEYMSCPFTAKRATECVYSLPFQRSPREIIVVETLLCSTKLTQNVDLLSLLRWRTAPESIGFTLSKIEKIDGAETVKFLQDVLDSLFAMFSTEDGNSTQFSGHVFHALVFIFSLLENAKFKHFKPVMDAYISDHFSAALVHKGLISCVKHLSDLCAQTDKQETILNCFNSLEYIFKFIVQSRVLYLSASGEVKEEIFKSDVDDLFESFAQLLANTSDHIIFTQVGLLEHIHGACSQLYRVLGPLPVLRHLNSVLYAISIDAPNIIVQAKLRAIKNLISSTVFQDPESRNLFIRMSTDHLRHHFMTKQELLLCADVFSEIVLFTYKQYSKCYDGLIHQDVKTIVLKLADVVIDVILSLDISYFCYEQSEPISNLTQLLNTMRKGSISKRSRSFYLSQNDLTLESKLNALSGSLIASLMGILQMMKSDHYTALWASKTKDGGSTNQLMALISSMMKLFNLLIKSPVFPPDWFTMRIVTNKNILNALNEIAQPLIANFLYDEFDSQLWTWYFNLSVGFLTQPSLQLEKFSPQKKQKLLLQYSDMRVTVGYQILAMWHKLGDIQRLHFIPSMVGPFLEVTLVPEPDLRRATLPIFFDMMHAEQQEKGNFKQVETELIDKLDILVSENKGDDEYRQVFNAMLLERVKREESRWSENGANFIQSVTRLLERLLDYRSVMQGDENSDKRMSCTVNLLNFYKNEVNRDEMYIRYIYKLADLHLPAGNFTEAGFTLKLHAVQLSWCSRMLHADHLYPAQTEFQRKEMIYYRIIEYFDKGKCWEEGIPLLLELCEQYRNQTFNYKKLSDVHRTLATFYENILSKERYKHEYFRVGFYGRGLPLFVRNKVFIYRGLEYESISAFTQRLQNEFSQAKLMNHNTPPDDLTKASDEQFIQICAVKPKNDRQADWEEFDVDERIPKYYQDNQVCKFVFDRPCHKPNNAIDKENEFKNLWIERIIYTTESKFPGILKWFEVKSQETEEICPPQYACETVELNIQQLKQMISHYKAHPTENIQPFTMRLQGSIDAAVNGGISKYHDAFFKREYLSVNPQFNDHVNNLKSRMVEQIQVLDKALELHGRIAPAFNQPLHRRLLEVFEELRMKVRRMSASQSQRSTKSLQIVGAHTPTHRRADSDSTVEFRRMGSIINSPLPPVPTDPREESGNTPSPSTSGHSSQRSSQSSSLYSHFQAIIHDEDLYAKPMEIDETTFIPQHDSSRARTLSEHAARNCYDLERAARNSYELERRIRNSYEMDRGAKNSYILERGARNSYEYERGTRNSYELEHGGINYEQERARYSYESIGAFSKSSDHSAGPEYTQIPSPKDERKKLKNNFVGSSGFLKDFNNMTALNLRDSCGESQSQSSGETVPPIPPKALDRASMKSSERMSYGSDDLPPPLYPKRLSRRVLNYSEDNSVSNGFVSKSPPKCSPPALSPKNQKSPTPPPIPPKQLFQGIPNSPHSVVSDFGSLEEGVDPSEEENNYSMPQIYHYPSNTPRF